MKKNNKLVWALASILLTIAFFCFFFGAKYVSNISTNFFSSSSADLLKDVYTTYYHIEHDTSYLKSNPMNYPYGDYYTYTGCQTLVSYPLQLMKNLGFENASRYSLLLINFYVLLSIFLCSLFLFLLFYELKLPGFVSMLGAVFITFISPQLQRIGGHITLSYCFIIPLILFLTLKNYNNPKFLYSVLLGIALIISGFAHPYYLMFFACLAVFYWGYIFFWQSERLGSKWKVVLHFSIQFLIPVICYLLLVSIGDTALDRTTIPNGFYDYRGRIEGVLFPYGRPYFIDKSLLFANIKWEARAYIGIVALVVFVGMVFVFFKKLFTKQFSSLLKVTDNTALNIFFWASLALLLFACGMPINWFPAKFLNYLGPIAQMRAMGRFEWLFFYVINIVAIYTLYQLIKQKIKKKTWKYVLTIIICMFYCAEDYAYAKHFKYWYYSEKPLWTDYDNVLEENNWVSTISAEEYQSILPLPVFNVGTEQLYLPDKDKMFEKAAYVSLKTGLSMHGNHASRSSIKQAYNNVAFAWDPWTVFPVMKDIKSDKPILLLTPTSIESFNDNEKRILRYADSLFTANDIIFYSLQIDSIYQLCADYQKQLYELYLSNKLYHKVGSIYSNDSLHQYYFQAWDNYPQSIFIQGNGSLKGIVNKVTYLYDSLLPVSQKDNIEISFWISDFTDDLYGRTKYKIIATNKEGTKTQIDNNQVAERVQAIKDGWGLIKIRCSLPSDTYRLSISLQNKEMLAKPVFFDNLLIKPIDTYFILEEKNNIMINNLNVNHKLLPLQE